MDIGDSARCWQAICLWIKRVGAEVAVFNPPWRRRLDKLLDGAASSAESTLSLQTPAFSVGRSSHHLAPSKRGFKRELKGRKRTACLFVDSAISNEIPPLQTMWTPIGEQAKVPIDSPLLAGLEHHALSGQNLIPMGAS